jgi:LacI family transcriptional regulator
MPRAIPTRVTMMDVARRAGVSQPLVSLVIAGNPRARVADATRERILQAARELGYRPNVIARSLVQRRAYAIGLIIPDLGNPFFADVVRGAERVAADQGYALLFCDAADVGVERHVEALRSRQIDGVIMDATGAASLGDGALAGLNVVLIDEPSARFRGVASDALGAGQLAAAHLLGLGHRRLGFLGPASDTWAFRMRERGFVAALRAVGIALESPHLRRAAPTVEGGKAAMRALLATPVASRPTAVFCANDLMALGAIKACVRARIGVPGEMSVMGCDDIEAARLVTPELSTVTVPARELGARAARMLFRVLEGEAPRPARPLPVALAARGTTAQAPS